MLTAKPLKQGMIAPWRDPTEWLPDESELAAKCSILYVVLRDHYRGHNRTSTFNLSRSAALKAALKAAPKAAMWAFLSLICNDPVVCGRKARIAQVLSMRKQYSK